MKLRYVDRTDIQYLGLMPVLLCMLYFKYSRMLITKIYVIHVQILKILYSNVFELRSVWKEKNLRYQNVISVPMYKIQRKKLWEKRRKCDTANIENWVSWPILHLGKKHFRKKNVWFRKRNEISALGWIFIHFWHVLL